MEQALTRREALKVDKSFYADEDNECWYVFGDNSGFAYSEHPDKETAERAAETMVETAK
jgi:hypothetical protein